MKIQLETITIEDCSFSTKFNPRLSDLFLIGSNRPPLNFDYGVKAAYQKVVAHLKKEFIETHFHRIPEL